jgi:hypothetical protein
VVSPSPSYYSLISGVSAIIRGKREVFFYFVPDTTRDYIKILKYYNLDETTGTDMPNELNTILIRRYWVLEPLSPPTTKFRVI